MSASYDRTGETWARLTVVGRSKKKRGKQVFWDCTCSCGGRTDIATSKIGKTMSCGCLKKASPPPSQRKHGASFVRGKATPEYNAWSSMKQRCHDRSNLAYGGRGIRVCDRWENSFVEFLKDMGERPGSMHSLDRIDVNGDYTPENCRWATIFQQSNNKRSNHFVSWRGKRMTVTEAARMEGKNVSTVRTRIGRGWTIERALQ